MISRLRIKDETSYYEYTFSETAAKAAWFNVPGKGEEMAALTLKDNLRKAKNFTGFLATDRTSEDGQDTSRTRAE